MRQGKSTQRKKDNQKSSYHASVSNAPGNLTLAYPKTEKPYRVTIRRGLSAPDEIRVGLRYTAQVAITNTVGVPNSYVFRGNSVFDPDYTGIGSQPNGFDQWKTMYQRYRVLGSKCIVRPVSTSTTLLPIDTVLCPVQDGIAVNVSLENLKCNKYAIENVLSQNLRTTLSATMSTSCLLGLFKDAVETERDYASDITTNPTKVWFWQISCGPVDGTSTATTQMYVDLEFDTVFFNRIDNALS